MSGTNPPGRVVITYQHNEIVHDIKLVALETQMWSIYGIDCLDKRCITIEYELFYKYHLYSL